MIDTLKQAILTQLFEPLVGSTNTAAAATSGSMKHEEVKQNPNGQQHSCKNCCTTQDGDNDLGSYMVEPNYKISDQTDVKKGPQW